VNGSGLRTLYGISTWMVQRNIQSL